MTRLCDNQPIAWIAEAAMLKAAYNKGGIDR